MNKNETPHQLEKRPLTACWLGLQHTGPSYRQSLPPQASKQITFGGMAFTRVSLAWEYDGFGTEIIEVIPEKGCG